ncbi:hypothetical protein KQX63_06855 [Rhodopseudomonas palustris]|uniref:hypothetical protein n=1 Tax=Rhodopseudomonas palustris TaxID=1076 RepID=UPI0021F2E2D3|nr:hypothetical protein [Rhodopseudomonas palustris]UYO45727.1 hypothetical protein KQX63_06855 [Rhodopseudomonas palustris]
MILYTVTEETRDAVVAALGAHGSDRLATIGIGRIRREDSVPVTAAIVAAWPADDDGLHRIWLSNTAGYIAWRAFILGEIAAGRGLRSAIDSYKAALGIETVPAFDYVCSVVQGKGLRPCKDAGRCCWSAGVTWVVADGNMDHPRKKWKSSAWYQRAHAHEVLADVGLALPGQYRWSPRATALFCQPRLTTPRPVLSPADDAAIAAIA